MPLWALLVYGLGLSCLLSQGLVDAARLASLAVAIAVRRSLSLRIVSKGGASSPVTV